MDFKKDYIPAGISVLKKYSFRFGPNFFCICYKFFCMSFTRSSLIFSPKCTQASAKRVSGIMGMVGQVEGKIHLEDVRIDGMIILK